MSLNRSSLGSERFCRRVRQVPVDVLIRRRNWLWIGHNVRKDDNSIDGWGRAAVRAVLIGWIMAIIMEKLRLWLRELRILRKNRCLYIRVFLMGDYLVREGL